MSRRFPQSLRVPYRYRQSPAGDWLTETAHGTVRLRKTDTGMWLAWLEVWMSGQGERMRGAALSRDKAVVDLERQVRERSEPPEP